MAFRHRRSLLLRAWRTVPSAVTWPLQPGPIQDGNDRPLLQEAYKHEERALGAWLHGQRIRFRNGILSKEHEGKLDAVRLAETGRFRETAA